jgi:C1A family cysteine protease
MARCYTWRPDVPDALRDHVFKANGKRLPESVDLRQHCSPVEDQGNLGSCTGNAIVGALEYLEGIDGGAKLNLSRLFVYWQERKIEGTVGYDAGAQIRDGVKVCAKFGVCSEAYWPYRIVDYRKEPGKRAYADARLRRITEYQRVIGFDNLQAALANKLPVVFGFSVYASFESSKVASTGVVPMPTKGEKLLGGHAALCVGYDNATQRVTVRNSWGKHWGLNGYCTMPYDYVSSRGLSDDFWLIIK